MSVAEHVVRKAAGDQRPSFSIVGGLVDKRVAKVNLVPVNGQVCRCCVVARGLDVVHRAPLGEVGKIFGDVGPGFSGVASDLHLAVVGAGPDQARLFRRLGQRENHAAIFHTDIVGREATRNLLAGFVIASKVGTDDLPTVAAIRGDVHKLAAHIDLVVVEGRDGDGKFPVEAVLHFRRRGAGNVIRPDLDFAVLVGALIETGYRATDAARTGAGGPDDVVIHGIGHGEAALASSHRVPRPARDVVAQEAAELQAVAGAAPRRAILPVAVNKVGDLVVDGDVIDLRDGQVNVVPGISTIDGNIHAAIVDHGHAIAIGGVDPHFVIVAAGISRHLGEGVAAIEGAGKRCGEKEHFVFVVRRNLRARVVMRAPAELPVGVDHFPIVAAVVGTPELPELAGAVGLGHAIACFNLRVHAVGIFFGDAHGDSTHGGVRQAMSLQTLPGCAAVRGFEQAASLPAAGTAPGVDFDLPHASKKDFGIVGIHAQVRAAGVFVDEEDFVPGLAAIGGAIYAALRLRPVGVAERARQHDVGIARIDLHAANAAGFFQSH